MSRRSISVAMAVFNGEQYLVEQIKSIESQLTEKDELIISYDPSSDRTLNIINEAAKRNNRIKVIINEDQSKGLVSNFENALRHCNNEIIFYSDQDDVWISNKVDRVCKEFENPKVVAVIHDAKIVDEKLNVIHESTFKMRNGNPGLFRNLVRLSYIGCCLAFKKEMLNVILPIPYIERAHDWWTGSICSCFGKMVMVKEQLILHRMHENNATPKIRAPFSKQILVRINLVGNLIVRRWSKINKL